jgi:hypothetical protein
MNLVNELKAHQMVLVFMCGAIGTLFAFLFFSTVQALCFGLITAVFTYSLLLSRAEQENSIQFTDLEPMPPMEESFHAEPVEANAAGLRQEAAVAPEFSPSANQQQATLPTQVFRPDFATPNPHVAPNEGSLEVSNAEAKTGAAGQYMRKACACWKCDDVMYLYTWPGHIPLQVEPPPEPLPDSIQLRRDLADPLAKHWVNTCLKCGAVQSDELVFEGPSGDWQSF